MMNSLVSTSLVGLAMLGAGVHDLLAQQVAPDLDGEPLSRLKAIYERGEFRGKRFQADWLSDSSGYAVQQRGTGANKAATTYFDVRTGEPTDKADNSTTVKAPSKSQLLLSPDGKRRLEFKERNLYVRDLESKEAVQLTERNPDSDISYRSPMWSPDGKHVAFIETDVTDVKLRSMLVPGDPSYPGVRKQRFARISGNIPALRIGIVDAGNVDSTGGAVQWIPIPSPDEGFYLEQVEWAGNSQQLLIEWLSRFRDKREFFLATVDGQLTSIFQQTDPAWVVASQARNMGLVWVKGGRQFVVINEDDGWRHAYLYSKDGQKLSLLTPGDYDIIERAVIDAVGGWYYFYASPDDATERHLYRVPLDGTGTLEQVSPTDQPGTHDYNFSPDRRWAFHTYSTFDSPPTVELVKVAGHEVVKVLEDNKVIADKMKSLIAHPTEFLKLETDDGISMDAWMIKPKDFDKSRQYPLFVYVYGEPHAQTVLNRWGAAQSHFHRVIADLGYVVVSIDNRGTPSPKGAAWRRSVFGSLGPISTEEQAAALKAIQQQCSFVDLSRVGIWGWSGGGSNTLNALFRKPDDYHVGIAVVPKPQPHLYNAWFQEIFMSTPEVNPDGYKKSAPINYAEGLKGKLLIITGSGETNTHIQIIEGLVDRLIELGKQFDYMVYPYRDHGLSEGRGTLVHVRMLIARYLLENLPPGAM